MIQHVMTGDGSPTLYNDQYSEYYHSISGAIEEAREKFVRPLLERMPVGKLTILDVGFGLGLNTAVLLDEAKGRDITVTGLEKDKKIIESIRTMNYSFPNYDLMKALLRGEMKMGCNLNIQWGNACDTIKKMTETFDGVFLDGFSPKKNPDIWNEEFLIDVGKRCRKGAVLTTYSCAGSVRRGLKKAGFDVMDGPSVGRRAPSTIAVRNGNV